MRYMFAHRFKFSMVELRFGCTRRRPSEYVYMHKTCLQSLKNNSDRKDALEVRTFKLCEHPVAYILRTNAQKRRMLRTFP